MVGDRAGSWPWLELDVFGGGLDVELDVVWTWFWLVQRPEGAGQHTTTLPTTVRQRTYHTPDTWSAGVTSATAET